MAKGRKAKPDSVKKLKGTYRPDRATGEVETVSKTLPKPPTFLCAKGKRHFKRLVEALEEIGAASETYVDTIALAADARARLDVCALVLKKQGFTYETSSTNGALAIKQRPEVPIMRDAQRHLQSLLSELGLTPASIAKHAVKPSGQEDDPWSEFNQWGKPNANTGTPKMQ